jgi:hypothetical protein
MDAQSEARASGAEVRLRARQIPSEIVNEQNDEGFQWPTKYFAYPAQCDAQAKAEKLAVSREVLVHLQDAIRDTYVPENADRIKAEGMKYKPVCELTDTHIYALKDVERRNTTYHTSIAPTYSTTVALHSFLTCKSFATCFREQRLSHCRSTSSREPHHGCGLTCAQRLR